MESREGEIPLPTDNLMALLLTSFHGGLHVDRVGISFFYHIKAFLLLNLISITKYLKMDIF